MRIEMQVEIGGRPGIGAWLSGLAGDLLAAAIVAFCTWLLIEMRGGPLGLDGFYHIRMAEMYASGEIQRAGADFHWMRHSTWNGHFSDKDYLWHILLMPFVWLIGSTPSALIHAAQAGSAAASGLVALVLVRVLRAHRVNWPFFWTLLLVIASDAILYRLSMTRSYLLSISLALLGWQAIQRRSKLGVMLIGVVYAMAYTAPHVLIAMAGLWGVIELLAGPARGSCEAADDQSECADQPASAALEHAGDEADDADSSESAPSFWRRARWAFAPLLFAVIGVGIGVAVHPQPLNMVRLWLVQNAGVLLQSWGADQIAGSVREWAGFAPALEGVRIDDFGLELAPFASQALLTTHIAALLLLLLPWMLRAVFAPERRPDRVDAFAWSCTLVFLALMLSSQRFLEYFYPFAILAAARLSAPALASQRFRAMLEQRRVRAGVALSLLGLVMLFASAGRPLWLVENLEESQRRGERMLYEYRDMAVAIKELVPAQDADGNPTLIYHPSWRAFSELFFWAPEYDYVVGLDPTFLYAHSPEQYRAYQWIRDGSPVVEGSGGPDVPVDQLIQREFGAAYLVVIPSRNKQLADTIERRIRLSRYGTKPAELLAQGFLDSWRLYRLYPTRTK